MCLDFSDCVPLIVVFRHFSCSSVSRDGGSLFLVTGLDFFEMALYNTYGVHDKGVNSAGGLPCLL